MDIINYFKHIENFSINYKPKKSKILIYDALSVKYAKNLFKNLPMTVFHTRYEGLSIYILFKTFFEKGFSNFVENYKKNFFLFVNPKIIYTAIDNNIGFYKLKTLFPKAYYIADQNGMRDKKFLNECKNFYKNNPSDYLQTDIYFCFGNNEKNKLKKFIKGKIFALGNTLNNDLLTNKFFFKKKIKGIVYISNNPLVKERFKIEKKIFKNLINFCNENALKLYYYDRPRVNNKNYIRKVFGDDFFFINNSKKNLKRLINSNFLFVNLHSTLGYELISRGVKCIFFNHHTLYHGKKYRKEGLFWSQNHNKNSVYKLLNNFIKMDQKKWMHQSIKFSKELCVFDKNNNKKKNIILKNCN